MESIVQLVLTNPWLIFTAVLGILIFIFIQTDLLTYIMITKYRYVPLGDLERRSQVIPKKFSILLVVLANTTRQTTLAFTKV